MASGSDITDLSTFSPRRPDTAFAVRTILRLLERESGRLLLWVPVAIGTGIGVYFTLPFEPPLWVGITSAVACAFLAFVTRDVMRLIFVVGCLGAVGFAIATARTDWVVEPVVAKQTRAIDIVGTVRSVEPMTSGIRVHLDAVTIGDWPIDQTPARVRINIRTQSDGAAAGARIALRAVLRPPPEPVAPGAFDFARQLYFGRVGAVGWAVSDVRAVGPARQARSWNVTIQRLRLAITERVLAVLDGDNGAVAAALLTGNRRAITDTVWEQMRRAGLAHLLAISGLHIGLASATIFFITRALFAAIPIVALRVPIKKWAAVAALFVALSYMLITGATVPTQRAFLMVGVVLFAVLIDRAAISMRLVAWAAVVILVLRPESLINISFQMSFAAVVALIATYEVARDRFRSARRPKEWLHVRGLPLYFVGVALTTCIASLATAPFAAFHFGQIATFGLVANLVAVPVTAMWIMPIGLLALGLMPFGMDAPALKLMGWGIDIVLTVAETVSRWPSAVWAVGTMPTFALVIIILGGLWICLWRRPWRWYGAGLICAGMVAANFATRPDILVNDNAKLFAIRDGTDRLLLSSQRHGRFAGKIWTRRQGQTMPVTWSPSGDVDKGGRTLRCDALGCRFEVGTRTAALVTDGRALVDDCGTSDVIISAVPVRDACPDTPHVVDRFDIWRNGAHAVFFLPDDIRIESVRARRGDRPWVTKRGR